MRRKTRRKDERKGKGRTDVGMGRKGLTKKK